MDNTEKGNTHDAHLGPSARRPADVPPQDSDEVTLEAEWRSGPRTRAWDELWSRLLDGLVDRDPDNDGSMPPSGTPPDS